MREERGKILIEGLLHPPRRSGSESPDWGGSGSRPCQELEEGAGSETTRHVGGEGSTPNARKPVTAKHVEWQEKASSAGYTCMEGQETH